MASERILYSGGAPGADALFGTFAERCGIAEQNYSFRDHVECRSRGRVILTPEDLEEADVRLQDVMGDTFLSKRSSDPESLSLRYWRRNWHQVKHTEQVFAVLNNRTFLDFTKQQPDGAGVAIALGLFKGSLKRVCVYLQNESERKWLEWRQSRSPGEGQEHIRYIKTVEGREEWKDLLFFSRDSAAIQIDEGDFTGIGTRGINSDGISAVKGLYKRSFPGHFS